MKKTVTTLLVSSFLLTSVASASEIKKTDCFESPITPKCVYVEKFSPNFYYEKIFEYLKKFNLPSIPGIDLNKPETDTDVSVPETNIPEVDTNIPETNVPEVDTNIPETNVPEIDTNIPNINIPETDTIIPETQEENEFALVVLELVNKERAAHGLSRLTLDSALSKVAQIHSLDMAKNRYFSHTNLKGQSPFDRLRNAGISYSTAGENIAMGQKTPQQVVSGWMNSEGHRANILNSGFGKMGLGTAANNSGGYYWTQIFTN